MKRSQLIDRMHQALLRRRDALRKALAGELGLIHSLSSQSVGDEMDRALDAAQGEINSQLADVESRELQQIEMALERLQSNQFGMCRQCDGRIPQARLTALPYATHCINCQRESERNRSADHSAADWGRIADSDTGNNHLSFNDIEKLSV